MSRFRRPYDAPPWTTAFTPPLPPQTDRVQLVVLGPAVAELDFLAIMGSRQRLRRELQWNGWPPDDFTLDDNRLDLARHRAEFDRREAYAYSVLDLAGKRCLGCVYLEPWTPGAQLAFWVVDEALDTRLEAHLLRTLGDWLQAAWPLPQVVVPFRPDHRRGRGLARELDLAPVPGPEGYESFRLVGSGTAS